MDCKNHPGKIAYNTCDKCHETVCDECVTQVHGRYVCNDCVNEYIFNNHAPMPSRMPHAAPRPHQFSSFIVFCLSMLPGAGHMYMGLMKKGLLHMFMFFGSIYLTAFLYHRFFIMLLGLCIPIVWFYSFFDANNCRRLLNSGRPVDDNIQGFTNIISNNKVALIIMTIVFVGISAVQQYIDYIGFWVNSPWWFELFRGALNAFQGLLIAVVGIFLILKSSGAKKKRMMNEFVDKVDLRKN